MNEPFPNIRFTGSLRPSQQEAAEIALRELEGGKRRLHIVAPPGSGKTVLGLYLWATAVRRPAVVLSPNSAIQSQWAARTDLFDMGRPHPELVSTKPAEPRLLTSLTYQSVTMPSRGGDDLDALAIERWHERLVERDQAKDPEEALVWVDDLRRHNRAYYEARLSAYRKEIRDAAAIGGDALDVLHASSLETLRRLGDRGVGLLILDECHHLMGHWGRVLADARELFEEPVVIGLTATPPDRSGKQAADVERYDEFFGPVDFEVPVPAVVKDGFLAPYQDLAYFVRPTADELAFVAGADDRLHRIVEQLCAPREPTLEDPQAAEPLDAWLVRLLEERRLPTGTAKDWASFRRRDPELADAARAFLLERGLALPEDVPAAEEETAPEESTELTVLFPVLDRYVRHGLRRSQHAADQKLAATVIGQLRTLGMQITETGSQACASPVSRVLGYSRSKAHALVPILKAEQQVLGDRIRAVVVADYEKTSAVAAEISHLLDDEAGGAVAAFKQLLRDPETDRLDPVLVTGSSVLLDDDLAERFVEAAQRWLYDRSLQIELTLSDEDSFHVLNGTGRDWCPRVYVAMITELFQRGLSKCLVGTRGLLGEGWDANKINVLVDLTTVTTSMTVNQLRGRSIRLDPEEPDKLADNWDVVCLAPEFAKGLDDYERFLAKHRNLFGVTDDGAIEKGAGHVHAAFTKLKPEGLERSVAALNADMLSRTTRRDEIRTLWRIGQPYHPEPVRTLEARPLRDGDEGGLPPFIKSQDPWTAGSLALATGEAVLGALHEAGLIKRKRNIHVGDRAGGYVRVFLEEADEEESALFSRALHEALGPLTRPRYVVPRHVDRMQSTWLSSLLPAVVGRYFRRRERRMLMLHAVPATLARNKDLVSIYQRHWNRHVSPGEAVYAHRGEGERLVDRARRNGRTPAREIHEKEVFL